MASDPIGAIMRRDRIVVTASLAALTLLAWVYLLLGAGVDMQKMPMDGQMMMQAQWTPTYGALVLLMWIVMMLAMMLPSAAPVILLVASIARRRAADGGTRPAVTLWFALGYVVVWLGFSALAAALQWRLDTAGLLSPGMAGLGIWAAGLTLIAVGVYQVMPLKQACLRHCRSPLDFLLYHWREGSTGALSSGIRHGLFCLGCCWMLMALLFVGGVMNLLWIAGISLLVLAEKTMPWGRPISWISGLVLVTWGLLALRAVV